MNVTIRLLLFSISVLLVFISGTSISIATNHIVQIRQVGAGANGDSTIQFVEMRMSNDGQNLWANRARLVFFDAAGNQTGQFVVPSNPPGGLNRSVLFATQAFANVPGNPAPDFIIPAGLLQPGSGKVCFKNTSDPGAFSVNLCLSYGNFTGDTEGGGPPAAALPITGNQSLKRLDAFVDFFGEPNQNSHFALGDATPQNSASPDLRITKSHSQNFIRGENGTYEIKVENVGFSQMSGTTTVTDTLPAGLSFVSSSGSGWTCSAAGQDVTCTNSNPIPIGASTTFFLTVAVGQTASSDTNTAVLSNPNDKFGANNSSSDFTTIIGAAPDLIIDKSHNGNFMAGDNGTYSILVQNIGTVATIGTTTVTDTLPSGLSFVSASGSGWSCSASGASVTCTNPNSIPVNQSSAFTLTVAVANSVSAQVTNVVSVSTPGESNTFNNSDSDFTAISVPCSVTPISFGQTLAGTLSNTDCFAPHHSGRFADLYTFTGVTGQQVAIRMNGSFDTFLILVDPSGNVIATNDDCIGAGLNSCIPGDAGSGGLLTLPSTGTYTIEATSLGSGVTGSYSVMLITNMSADLEITKNHTGSFVVGTTGVYTMTVHNEGPDPTIGTITVTDVLHAGLSFVSGTGTGWNCSAVGQTVTCTHSEAIAVEGSASFDLVVNVGADAAPSVTNTATVTSVIDPNPANDSASDATQVVGDNHLVQIRQVITGANNSADIQFVEARMSDPTQSLWANRVKLVFFDANDNQTGEFVVPSNPPAGVNKSVLFATQQFAALPGAPLPDFIIPSVLLQPGSGKVCFRNTDHPDAVPINLCLSYGSFTGDTEGAGSPAAALPVSGARSLKRRPEFAALFGNPDSNQNSQFVISDARPESSTGPTSPMSFFFDVPASHFAGRHIQAMANAGITAGCGVANFCPENSVTRAQMSVFIIRAMGQTPVDPPTGVFLDVPPGAFAAGFIERMAQIGITSGCGGGNFCPNNAVTRAQMAVFIIRAIGQTPVDPPTGVFADVPPGSFAAGFIERMAQLGITSGCGGGNFCPNASVTRSQMAVFIQRAFSLSLPE